MLRNILNIKSKDKVRLTEIHKESEVKDIEWVNKKLKLSYVRHLVGKRTSGIRYGGMVTEIPEKKEGKTSKKMVRRAGEGVWGLLG